MWGRREVQEGGDTCTHIADSLHCTVETNNIVKQLLLLLSRFSHVRLCATPQMAAHQAPLSLGFSSQEHAISFSNVGKWKVKVKSLSRVQLLATPWTATYQAPPSMGFSRQENWSGLPLPSPIKQLYSIKKRKKIDTSYFRVTIQLIHLHYLFEWQKIIVCKDARIIITAW